MNENERSSIFICTVGGSPQIDGARSIVQLPFEMNRKEALEYLKTHALLSVSGDIVVYILHPLNKEQMTTLGYRQNQNG